MQEIKIIKKIINGRQKTIDIEKKSKNHYKLFKKTIDEQQKEIDALKILLKLANKYKDIVKDMTSR